MIMIKINMIAMPTMTTDTVTAKATKMVMATTAIPIMTATPPAVGTAIIIRTCLPVWPSAIVFLRDYKASS